MQSVFDSFGVFGAARIRGVSPNPPVTAGLVLDLAAEDAGVADGVRIVSMTERSASANTLTEAGSGRGPVYRADYLGYPCLDFWVNGSATGSLFATGATPLITALAAANAQFEVISVFQPIGTASAIGGWTSTTNGQRFWIKRTHDSGAGLWKKSATSRFSSSGAVQNVSPAINVKSPQVWSWSRDASQAVRFEVDGNLEHTFTVTDGVGFTAIDRYVLGAVMFGNTTPTYQGRFKLWRQFVWNRRLTTQERADVYAWIAAKWPLLFARKKGLSGATSTGNTYVFPRIGQSNMLGLGDTIVQPSGARLWTLGFDNVVRAAAEPTGVETNCPYASTGGGGGTFLMNVYGQSMGGAMLERLRLDLTDDLLDVPCAVGGTDAASWNTGTTQNPPQDNGLTGMTKHRILEAMRNAPNAVLGGIALYQGEADATAGKLASFGGDHGALQAAWVANWNAVFDELNAWVAAQGYTWRDDKHFFIFTLPASNPQSQAAWADINAAVATLVAGRSDAAQITSCDGPHISGGPHDQHIDTGQSGAPRSGQQGNGYNLAEAILAG